jgi:aminopeptidase YwaD
MRKEFTEFCSFIDIANSRRILDTLSSFGDDKATGNRSAGSRASTDAAEYLYQEFNRCGLKTVTVDQFHASGWTYKGAYLVYKDEYDQERKIVLGGYATGIEADDISVGVVDAFKGRISDYKTLGEVKDKIVLVRFNPWNDFWVSYPAYQAYLLGAKAVLAVTDYAVERETRLVSQPIQGPPFAPVLAICARDSDILKALIARSKAKEITVTLKAHSCVYPSKTSYNIWGEIPGITDEVIYLIAHYDGYYHSCFDDASGVSTILGIAKAIVASGYRPDKTIRIVAHGAEEWGKADSDYDWATGAFEQITHIHPEWAERAFALVNIDGNFPVARERNFQIHVSSELRKYVADSTAALLCKENYNFEIISANTPFSEEFSYARAGIPCITARDSFETSIYYTSIYHSSMDSASFGFNNRTYQFNHILYGKILFDLDATYIRPMDFYQRFQELKASLNETIAGTGLVQAVQQAAFYAYELSVKIKKINEGETTLINKSGNLNVSLYKLYKKMQDSLLRLDWSAKVIFPHENCQTNIELLVNAIKALRSGGGSFPEIVDKYIKPIDNNRYVYDFDRRCYLFFAGRVTLGNEGTWGFNLVEKPNEDLYEVAQSLKDKFYDENPDVSEEIKSLEIALKRQTRYLDEIITREIGDVREITAEMKHILQTASVWRNV